MVMSWNGGWNECKGWERVRTWQRNSKEVKDGNGAQIVQVYKLKGHGNAQRQNTQNEVILKRAKQSGLGDAKELRKVGRHANGLLGACLRCLASLPF